MPYPSAFLMASSTRCSMRIADSLDTAAMPPTTPRNATAPCAPTATCAISEGPTAATTRAATRRAGARLQTRSGATEATLAADDADAGDGDGKEPSGQSCVAPRRGFRHRATDVSRHRGVVTGRDGTGRANAVRVSRGRAMFARVSARARGDAPMVKDMVESVCALTCVRRSEWPRAERASGQLASANERRGEQISYGRQSELAVVALAGAEKAHAVEIRVAGCEPKPECPRRVSESALLPPARTRRR